MRRIWGGAGLMVGCLLAASLLAGAAAVAPDSASPEATTGLRLRNEGLARQLELAAGKSFYLVLDPAAARLTLNYRGAELHRWAVAGSELGIPRTAFVRRSEPRGYAGVIWSGGTLTPPRPDDRIEINVSGPDQTEPEPPPPPEVAIPVPASYVVEYAAGLALEITRAGAPPTGWRARAREVRAAVSPAQRRITRIRLVLSAADADGLYRSLPPDTALLILAPAPEVGHDVGAAGSQPAATGPAPRAER
jgi:hypothetical protein